MTEQEELKRDMIEGLRQDAHHEAMLRRDIDYAIARNNLLLREIV